MMLLYGLATAICAFGVVRGILTWRRDGRRLSGVFSLTVLTLVLLHFTAISVNQYLLERQARSVALTALDKSEAKQLPLPDSASPSENRGLREERSGNPFASQSETEEVRASSAGALVKLKTPGRMHVNVHLKVEDFAERDSRGSWWVALFPYAYRTRYTVDSAIVMD
jgi:hypothetical protein